MYFTVVPGQDGALAHHLEECSLLPKIIFSYITSPFIGTDEGLGCTM